MSGQGEQGTQRDKADKAERTERTGLEAVEMELLLEGVYRRYGLDFRNYAYASLRRRVRGFAEDEQVSTVSGLLERVLHERACLERFVRALSVHVTAMFRDPTFYAAFRLKVVPLLRTYPFVRLWHAGCSTGEEVYSMAILLEEEGLYDRCRIYATDLSEPVLEQARSGVYTLAMMKEHTLNYQQAGGKRAFSDYYTVEFGHVRLRPSLRDHVVFAQHNLVSDGSFNEFNVILCRNVLIYFNRSLQQRVHGLLYESLGMFGVLGLGRKESLRFTPQEPSYAAIDERERLFRRVR